MGLSSEYRSYGAGKRNLWVHSEMWSENLWDEVLRFVEDQRATDHPQIVRFHFPPGKTGSDFYLKIYSRSRFWSSVKDLCRNSKAFRSLKMGCAMSRLGFYVPLAVAAGEERRFRLLRRAFLLTLAVEGSVLPLFLRDYGDLLTSGPLLRKKRECVGKLGYEIRRLHACGFVHGDMIPTNILIRNEGEEIAFFYIDNDRTRRYRFWVPSILKKRNLIQLNRFVLHGISLQDRMRFLRSYLRRPSWGRRDRRLIRWLEKKTRLRRMECDRVEASVSFRELMRWNGPFAKNS